MSKQNNYMKAPLTISVFLNETRRPLLSMHGYGMLINKIGVGENISTHDQETCSSLSSLMIEQIDYIQSLHAEIADEIHPPIPDLDKYIVQRITPRLNTIRGRLASIHGLGTILSETLPSQIEVSEQHKYDLQQFAETIVELVDYLKTIYAELEQEINSGTLRI